MRLIRSSDPDAVARDDALRLLAERAVLTRGVCRELLEAPGGGYATRRTRASLWSLLHWVADNAGPSLGMRPGASDGIEQMIVPAGSEQVVVEIRAGARVCDAFFMPLTADSSVQAEGDRAQLTAELDAYWADHSAVADLPFP